VLSPDNHPTEFDDTRRQGSSSVPGPRGIGVADFTWPAGDLTFTGIALGSIAALLVYHGMQLSGLRASRRDEQHGV
jgi:hypothetical protein